MVRNSVGQAWRTDTHVFEAYTTANYANYTIAMTEQGTASAFYAGTFPTQITAGIYSVSVLLQAGGSPVETDDPVGTGNLDWNGATAQSLGVVAPANVVPGASGGLPTVDSSNQVKANVTAWAGDAAGIVVDGNHSPKVTAWYFDILAASSFWNLVGATPCFNSNVKAWAGDAAGIAVDAAHLPLVDAMAATVVGNVTVGGYAVGQDPATLLFAGAIEAGVTFKQATRAIAAAAAGVLSVNAGTSQVTISAIGNALTTRIVSTYDINNERTAVTLTL